MTADRQPAHGLFGPGIFGSGIDLSALDEDTAWRLGQFMGEQLRAAAAERDILRAQLSDSRALCFGHVDGRDLDQARAERDEAVAEVERFRQLHQLLWPIIAAARDMRARYAPEVGPSNEALFQPEELALIRAIDESTVASEWVNDRLVRVYAEQDDLAARLERAERVVEAARALVGHGPLGILAAFDLEANAAWVLERDSRWAAVMAAVDAYQSAPSRTWRLPPEPGLEVTRVLDAYGQYFERQHDEHPGDDEWIGTTFTAEPDVPDLVLEWPMLMAYQAPLTDATPSTSEPADTAQPAGRAEETDA